MPSPAVALKLKKFRRRFGIAAPRVTVRSHVGWQWYGLGLAILVALVAAVVWSVVRQGDASGLMQENRELRQQLSDRAEELMRLRVGAATEQNAVQMERSTQQQLVSRINVLERENAGLKEDISLLERLVKDCPRKMGAARHN
ncbi:MAG: hypothetical protein H6R10_2483 [Rhodocyclaceae bacterium]|nr:hypothetical protein [Rhodocyclaceae bacterium]